MSTNKQTVDNNELYSEIINCSDLHWPDDEYMAKIEHSFSEAVIALKDKYALTAQQDAAMTTFIKDLHFTHVCERPVCMSALEENLNAVVTPRRVVRFE